MCAVQVVFLDDLPILGYKGCGQSGPYDHPLKYTRTGVFFVRCVVPAAPHRLRPLHRSRTEPYPTTLRPSYGLWGAFLRALPTVERTIAAKTVPPVTQVYKTWAKRETRETNRDDNAVAAIDAIGRSSARLVGEHRVEQAGEAPVEFGAPQRVDHLAAGLRRLD